MNKCAKGRWRQSRAPVQLQLLEGWQELQRQDVTDQCALAQVDRGDMGKLWQNNHVLVACPVHVAGQPVRTQIKFSPNGLEQESQLCTTYETRFISR